MAVPWSDGTGIVAAGAHAASGGGHQTHYATVTWQSPQSKKKMAIKHHETSLKNHSTVYFSVVGLRMGPHIVRNEGPLGLFKGVDASAARQLVYSGVAWLEQVFFLHVPSFFHFGSFGLWTRFFHSNF